MPLHMRLPKLKGFRNRFRVEYQVVNVGDLAELFPDGGEIGPTELVEAGAVRRKGLVKVLGEGDLDGVALDRHARTRSPAPPVTRSPPLAGTVNQAADACAVRRGVRPAPRRGLRSRDRAGDLIAAPGGSRVLSAFRSALATPDLRKKILFTLGDRRRLPARGPRSPRPGSRTPTCRNASAGRGRRERGVYSLLNLFSGGALLQLSIFALGIMPYITSSIIVQLLTVVIPRFEQLKKEGQSGQNKLTQYTRYLTIALAILQGTGHRRAGRPRRSCSATAAQPVHPGLQHLSR